MEPSVEKSARESEPASDAGTPVAAATGYQVVARRYRPQRFDELVGQEHVARGLSGAIESGRIGADGEGGLVIFKAHTVFFLGQFNA